MHAAPFMMTEAVEIYLPETGANIIHISSVRAKFSEPHCEVMADLSSQVEVWTHPSSHPLQDRCHWSSHTLPIIAFSQSNIPLQGYASAKAGLLGLTHSQAVSLAKRCRVNAILPGRLRQKAV